MNLNELIKDYMYNVRMREALREGTKTRDEFDTVVKYLESKITKLLEDN